MTTDKRSQYVDELAEKLLVRAEAEDRDAFVELLDTELKQSFRNGIKAGIAKANSRAAS